MELQARMPEPRPCVVRQERAALLHGLFAHAWTHGESIAVGGFCAGQETMPMALVEYEDGRLDAVGVDAVRMLDSSEHFDEYEWEWEGGSDGQ